MEEWKKVGSFVWDGTPMPTFNPMMNLAKRHWSNYSKTKDKWTKQIQWKLKAAGFPKFKEGTFRLEIDWYLGRKTQDIDNAGFSRKFIFDALEKEKVVPNDNIKHIVECLDRAYHDKDRPRVEVRLYKRVEDRHSGQVKDVLT